ncbi:MAG: endolytic transglycosylase MltG [Bradymonadia bacterium]
MRLIKRLILLALVGGIGIGAYGYVRVTNYLDTAIGAAGTIETVKIPKGITFKRAVAQLSEAGVVTDPMVFEWYARMVEQTDVKAGTYAIDLGTTPRDLLEQLGKGGLIPQVKITVPEGLNKWEIADLLSEKGLVDRAKFLQKIDAEKLEGRLFPDTYQIRNDATLDQIVARLTGRFDEVFSATIKGELPEGIESPEALLTLASLVEKEARVDEERPIIARVFLNRIAKGMKLQTDPTCVYGAELYTQKPHPRYCKDPANRYSTYVIDGLPPSPIANPGAAAIKAAMHPAEDDRAKTLLFFVAKQDGSGRHVFTADYKDHVRAVNRYLRGK